jgi:hypothetical protein
MSSSSTKSGRRKTYLSLVGKIEGQLRDAYAKRHAAGLATQSSIGQKLGVGKSVVNRRLRGGQNMTIETLADMVWALQHEIDVEIYDPAERVSNSGGFTFLEEEITDDAAPYFPATETMAESSGKVLDAHFERVS